MLLFARTYQWFKHVHLKRTSVPDTAVLDQALAAGALQLRGELRPGLFFHDLLVGRRHGLPRTIAAAVTVTVTDDNDAPVITTTNLNALENQTSSGTLLMVVGAALVGLGIYRMVKGGSRG